MKPSNVLVLPGWQNSGPQHWQSLWEQRYGYVRVDQHDWDKPRRGDWVARLEEVLLTRDEPAVLVQPIDLGKLDVQRTHWPFLRDRRIDAYGEITKRFIDE